MKTISMVEFRLHAERVIREAMRGEAMILTYRGKPAIRLQPIEGERCREDDPFYRLDSLAAKDGESLTNAQMDKVIYE
ncbi:MAG: type II toxin-antitoxin system prevent-host-death family antitoxin [Candidatus Aureabacteria bacterium]|nr:type II toxin-antitoxin system prevent-host-death family antitoxin [Candidatus Auribacterota bacterium]